MLGKTISYSIGFVLEIYYTVKIESTYLILIENFTVNILWKLY